MANYRMTEYQGGWNTLDPDKAYNNSFTGYRGIAGSITIATDPRSANILKEASAKLSSGAKNVELVMASPEIFDSIPKQHLKEINELSKLTGIDVSVHGPVIDTAGFTQQGYSDINRQATERKIADVVIRSQEVKPDGNVPVVFHSAEGIAGSEWQTLGDDKSGEARTAKRLIAVNKKTGQMIPIEKENFYVPGGEKIQNEPHTPEEGLEIANRTEWDNKVSQLFFNKERADEILQQNYPQIQGLIEDLNSGKFKQSNLTPTQQMVFSKFKDASLYLREINKKARNYFSEAYEYGNEEQKKALELINQEYRKELEKIKDADIIGQSQAVRNLLVQLENPALAPEIFVPIEEFATEKSSQTFGNAAYQAYKKFGDKTPIIAIENPPAGFGLSTGEDLRNLVKASREKFAENLIKEGMNKKQAQKTAEKFIGATWDVGHINMLRKQGFSEQDIIKESEKIAPFVKHVHLSDNFGFEHTELPMGMGNVPFKEIMEKLGKKGFEAKKVVEAAQWWQHFQTNPFKETLEGFGSPIFSSGYSAGGPPTVGGMPYWNQALGFQQSYGEGFGRMLPGINYQTFGAGFSQLPSHLGGDAQGGQGSRMSGRPME